MDDQFVVLGSGSSGNCTFVGSSNGGFLIDCGFDGRVIGSRLSTVGYSWNHVRAVVLTHTHTDHWKGLAFDQLKIHRIPLYIHPLHRPTLNNLASDRFDDLTALGLIREFEPSSPLLLPSQHLVTPIWVPHDSDPTFAFRVDGPIVEEEPLWSVGYASDLGAVTPELLTLFQNVQVLALEFNHDVEMQKASGRSWTLIRRVLSDKGHLSNVQGGKAVETIVSTSRPHTIKYVVPLHLSKDCNRERLALEEARKALNLCGSSAEIVPARQDVPTRLLPLYAKSTS